MRLLTVASGPAERCALGASIAGMTGPDHVLAIPTGRLGPHGLPANEVPCLCEPDLSSAL